MCKEQFPYLYDGNISPICSQPTVGDLIRKYQRYAEKLDEVNQLLAEKNISGELSGEQSSRDSSNSESFFPAGQKSPPGRNILDFSCSDDCTCDKCTHFKFAYEDSSYEENETQEKPPVWFTTSKPKAEFSKIDVVQSQDNFEIRNVSLSYLCDLESRIEKIRKRCEITENEDYHLTVIDAVEKSSLLLDKLLK